MLGIAKGNRAAMHAQHSRNYRFFDAPVGLMIMVDRSMGRGSLLDCGMLLQSLMVARLKARQGVRAAMLEQLRVAPEGGVDPVACDGASPGEILVRGNTVMMGYLMNSAATAAAFLDGWFHTGDVAVVAQPDDKWGEVPCAFVEMKAGADGATEGDVIAFCRQRLAHFKCPQRVVFCEVPKTATGKIQKFKLRQQAGSCEAIMRIAV